MVHGLRVAHGLVHSIGSLQEACCLAVSAAARIDTTTAAAMFVRCMSSGNNVSSTADPSKAPLQAEQVGKVVAARQQLIARSHVQLLRVKGVTFEGRQDAVQHLHRWQPVMFVKEPSNPHDPGAVQIATLSGATLGWVSRKVKDAFQLPVCFGRVVSVGQAKQSSGEMSGKWGALVSCIPSIWSFSIDMLPESRYQSVWTEQLNYLDIGRWPKQSVQGRAAADKYQWRCALTGIPESEMPLHLVPQLNFDYTKKQVSVFEYVPMCQPLARAKLLACKLPGLTSTPDEKQLVGQLIMRINGWSTKEYSQYVHYVEERSRQVEGEDWTIDGYQLEYEMTDKEDTSSLRSSNEVDDVQKE